MKRIIFLCIAIASIASCKKDDNNGGGGTTVVGAQVTSAVVISSMSANTKRSGYKLDSGIIAFPISDTNVRYNYATVSDINPWSDSLKTPNNSTDYPTATYMTGFNQSLFGVSVDLNQFYSVNSSAWQDLGSYLKTPLNTTISGYTLTAAAQASKNNPVRNLVKFPIQYGNSYTENSSASVSTTVSGTYLGSPFSTPLTITNAYKTTSNNISYGYLKLKGYTDSLAVVVQKFNVETTTTFTTGSAFLDAALNGTLSTYGYTNGQKTNTVEYRYWAKDKGLVMTLGGNGVAYVRKGL